MKITMDILERIVREDNKQRYSFNWDKTLIKANQGHSIDVDLKLEPVEPPEILYHGTGKKYIDSILKDGIKKISRQFVHLSSNIEMANSVGTRHCELLVLFVDSKKIYEEGYKFYLSENKIWLTDHVPKNFIEIQDT